MKLADAERRGIYAVRNGHSRTLAFAQSAFAPDNLTSRSTSGAAAS